MFSNCNKKSLLLAFCCAGVMSAGVFADCGTPPEEPQIPDGASASFDELIAASKVVKAYIAGVDGYLDCREALMATDEFKAQGENIINAAKEEVSTLTKHRNDIGDNFNKEVGAYKKANPS